MLFFSLLGHPHRNVETIYTDCCCMLDSAYHFGLPNGEDLVAVLPQTLHR